MNNKIELDQRQSEVREMLLSGKASTHICNVISKQYGVSKKSIERDITICYRELRRYIEKAKEDIISEHIGKYDKIFNDCMDVMNHRDALRALKQKEELLKYHRNEPLIAVQNNTFNMENISTDDLLKAVEELKTIDKDTK